MPRPYAAPGRLWPPPRRACGPGPSWCSSRPAAGQPRQWTLLDFTAAEADAEALAERLAACLAPTGGWYVNYNTTAEAFVVFAGRVFRYPRGQDPRGRAEGRRQARAHARSLGIPEGQLDWQD